jgi:hypothetical protein
MFVEERMSDEFTKFHLEGPWPFQPAFHRFTGPDVDGPHDHPWDFTTHIIHGGYEEEVYEILPDGNWKMDVVQRLPGTAHFVRAGHIHRITRLLADECWTMVLAAPVTREVKFWYFDESGISYRYHKDYWTLHKY